MPRFIHLNGPPGIGKSTLAQLYADRNPAVLNLDIDQIVCLIGGWQDRFGETLPIARRLAIGMARTHLGAGHDVVMPQLVTSLSEIERFETAARDHHAEFCEIVLTADIPTSLMRLARRSGQGDRGALSFIDELIKQNGGQAFVAKIYGQLTDFLRDRPGCSVIHTDARDAEHTYTELARILAEAPEQAASSTRPP